MSLLRVLVANRGEIACRVVRTLRALGLEACAVYSEADAGAPHVALAHRAAPIGPPAPSESYLSIPRVVEAARAMGCDAVHPGYGFLSENADFAEACAEAGLVFIGPRPDVIRAMGDKARARRIAEEAGVGPVPGYEGDDDDDRLLAEARRIGFPLLVKAARGGGGKGMRRVDDESALAAASAAARREARGAFGDDSLILERLVRPARHVEVQVFGDGGGRAAALVERECSLQRRHQKVLEECPSPAVGEALRGRLCAAARRLADHVGYEGAGTVEFLLGADGSFHFLEMNTRLQVEHGVTELVTGLDLVALQVLVAGGEPLPWSGDVPVEPRGHALEARVYAEDPRAGFLPQSGRLADVVLPRGPGVRVDAGVTAGQSVTPDYDPLLLKVLSHGADREAARGRLAAALAETVLAGVTTNNAYLLEVLASEAFRGGRTFTHTLEEELPPEPAGEEPPEAVLWLAAAALSLPRGRARAASGPWDGTGDRHSPFDQLGRFRLVGGGREGGP